ncbi:DNA segregation ATPase FtsK/SpoIIIE related protein [Secundilactobacillus oryzae JCM 18671]|uniref:DNA translocase FtsK n=1 Tax=Secundilactobacillus oryzae JCM 18671 TaxID=1291743 RepID=A0A081BG37_9LACO|nr:DNA translocase FtsK [Secundilactobacillus oryzae]GAK47005.1 DNA segregation ATPase FtsK/SpoIIIE related protein [Secundilactobacillus oryzae JCM 18671]
MGHYDGPAFYRKYPMLRKRKQQEEAQQQNKQAEKSSQSDGYLVSSDVNRRAVVKRAQPKSEAKVPIQPVCQPELKEPAATASWEQNRIFHPTRIPKPLNRQDRQRDLVNYNALLAQIRKDDDSYLLFGSEVDEQLTDSPLDLQLESVEDDVNEVNSDLSVPALEESQRELQTEPEQTPESSLETVEPRPETSRANNAITSSLMAAAEEASEINEPVKPVEDSESAKDAIDHSEQDLVEILKTADERQSVSNQVNHPDAKQEALRKRRKRLTERLKKRAENKKSAAPNRGLGLSLGNILDDEAGRAAQETKLSLFNQSQKEPHTEPETSNATPNEAETDVRTHAYHFPETSLLKPPVVVNQVDEENWTRSQSAKLDETLKAFNVDAEVTDWTIGPTVTQFQVHLALGVKVSKITNLTDDLKLALAAKDIRIEAPIPGKNTVGIEIPNPQPRPVMLSEIVNSEPFKASKSPLTVALGVDLFGKPQVTDLRKMPHGLIAGATGAGKSVFINSVLVSLLYKATPEQLRLLLIDPKAVEMAPYDGIPHLLSPVISDPKTASAALKWMVKEMDQRYEKLAAAGARNIEQFNEKAEANQEYGLKMPYIVVVIDELADLMMVASSEVEDYIVRITQKARAAGIHLLVATQRPSVDVVTGIIKNNIPARIAFMVSSQIDSRTILDTGGAERLLGRGDMLYLGNSASQPIRLQGAFIDAEVESITAFVRSQQPAKYEFSPDSLVAQATESTGEDDLMPAVMAFISKEDTVSTSKLQRVFSIGYNRAANIIDELESRHYISEQHGSKPRDIYLTPDDMDDDHHQPLA